VARTVNVAERAIRRDAFVDAAQRLIQAKGYDRMSIQDVLDDLDASRGAFYHYFDSKAALLEAVIDRMVEAGIARFGPAIDDPGRTAIEKFGAFFADIAEYKAEHRALIFGFMRVWLSDENAVVREHFRRSLVGRVEPLMTPIVRQGVAEGVFTVASPDAAARVLVSLLQGMNEDITGLFLALDAGDVSIDHIQHRLDAYVDAFERILGAPPGSLPFADSSLLQTWHEWQQDYRKDMA
jgi:AcrR family transcriptional regulator